MKRNLLPRAPSPTPTAFSAISNYRSEAYCPINSKGSPPAGLDSRAVAKIHYEELSRFLASYLAGGKFHLFLRLAVFDFGVQHHPICNQLLITSSPGSPDNSSKNYRQMQTMRPWGGQAQPPCYDARETLTVTPATTQGGAHGYDVAQRNNGGRSVRSDC